MWENRKFKINTLNLLCIQIKKLGLGGSNRIESQKKKAGNGKKKKKKKEREREQKYEIRRIHKITKVFKKYKIYKHMAIMIKATNCVMVMCITLNSRD